MLHLLETAVCSQQYPDIHLKPFSTPECRKMRLNRSRLYTACHVLHNLCSGLLSCRLSFARFPVGLVTGRQDPIRNDAELYMGPFLLTQSNQINELVDPIQSNPIHVWIQPKSNCEMTQAYIVSG